MLLELETGLAFNPVFEGCCNKAFPRSLVWFSPEHRGNTALMSLEAEVLLKNLGNNVTDYEHCFPLITTEKGQPEKGHKVQSW